MIRNSAIANLAWIAMAPVLIGMAMVCAAAAPAAPARKAAAGAPAIATPAAAKTALVGNWDATPALDEINLMAMDQSQDSNLARARAIGQRVIYTFGPGPAMRIVILARQGPRDEPVIDRLKPQTIEATWDVVKGPKGLVLQVTPKNGGKPMEQPLTFVDEDAITVETDLVEDLGYRPSLQFRRNIGDRVIRWLKANNAVGGDKAPMVADLGKGVAPFVERREDFRIRIGGGLMTSGKPTEVFAISEQLFVRELTDADAAKIKLAKKGATTAHWPSKDAFPVLTEASISVPPKFDARAGRIDLRKPITGTVTFAEVNRMPTAQEATYVVRVSMVIGDQMSRAFYRSVGPMPGATAWKFSVDPPKDLADYAGPVRLFVDLCRETKFEGSGVVMQVLSPSADASFQAGK